VIRITRRTKKIEASKSDASGAVINLDKDMHTLGMSLMIFWLNSVVYCMRSQGITVNFCWAKAEKVVEATYKVFNGTNLL
jgi:hypothetical protein